MGNLNFIVYFLALVIFFFSSTFSDAGSIGVDYSRFGDLPEPSRVIQLLKNNSLNRVKIYDTDASVMRALSGSGIKVIVAVPNEQLASVAGDQNVANQWVERNISDYYPSTEIIAIAVGNENLNGNIVPAMRNIHKALRNNNLQSAIKVSSPIVYSAVENTFPPSAGRFRGDVQPVIKPMLEFLRQTGSYLMVNIYPFYVYSNNGGRISLDYAVFRPNPGVVDSKNGLRYTSLFDAQVDATYAAMSALGYSDLKLVVTESGWPSFGDQIGADTQTAAAYYGNLVERVLNGGGTPLRPNDTLDVYLFALFNEYQREGPSSGRNLGLFYPNQQKVYPISFTGGGVLSTNKTIIGGVPSTNETIIGGVPSTNKTIIGGVPSTNKTIIGGIPSYNGTFHGGLPLRSKIMIGVFVGVGVVGGLILLFLLFIYRKNRMKSRERIMTSSPNVEQFLETYGCLSLQRYKYRDIKKMTNSFKDKLGQGGYGSVFKGKLVDGRLVAVKVLINDPKKGNGEEFMNEVATIGRTNHINVVSLLGFCVSGSKRALVYEFMPNGSLEKFIYAKKENSTTATTSEITSATTTINTIQHLGWEKLYQIALGIARGLEYLHRGCNTGRILHFDIKPHNILLDEKFCPKISDFGLAKLCPTRESIVSMHGGGRGTLGYIAPEVYCRNFGGVSYKSDVYSYGMMVLEMVGGRKNIDPFVDNTSEIYFPHWIYDHLEDQNNKIEDLLRFEGEFEEEMARKMIMVGLWCIQTNPSNRPSMSRVSEMLEGRLEDLKMPPKPIVESFSPRASSVP